MADFELDARGLKEAMENVDALPHHIQRAKKSAMSSATYYLRTRVRKYIEKGGEGWPAMHPMTRKIRAMGGYNSKAKPYAGIAPMVRYKIDKNGNRAEIGYFTRALQEIAEEAETGATIPVTKRSRKHMAGRLMDGYKRKQGRRPPLDQIAVRPWKKTTSRIKIPQRKIFEPVYRKFGEKASARLEERFFRAIERYQTGKDNKDYSPA